MDLERNKNVRNDRILSKTFFASHLDQISTHVDGLVTQTIFERIQGLLCVQKIHEQVLLNKRANNFVICELKSEADTFFKHFLHQWPPPHKP